MKKLGTCPAAQKFQLLPRMISRLVHGNEVEFHARHENLNFMPGMKSDDIEATVRKRGCISCPAWKYKFHTRFMPGMKSGDIEATARKRGCISCPAWKSKFHAGHEIGGNLNFTPGMKISFWLISSLAGHEFRFQPVPSGAWNLVLALSAVENLDVFCR